MKSSSKRNTAECKQYFAYFVLFAFDITSICSLSALWLVKPPIQTMASFDWQESPRAPTPRSESNKMAALQPYQRLLLENRDVLLREIRTDDVCPLLFYSGVLAQKEIDEIKIGRSWPERAESLLDLLHYKGEQGFREFCAVLEDKYPHLSARLQSKNATVEIGKCHLAFCRIWGGCLPKLILSCRNSKE